MLPYIQAGPWHLGPFTIHLFGILVGIAIILGVTMSQRDADRRGLNPLIVSEMQIWAIVVGFLVAHWFAVIFYFPERVKRDPLELLWIWKGISSFGGFIGGVGGLVFYLKVVKKVDPWPYIDSIGYGFAWAWIFGRMGCTTAHDHPGRLTDLAFSVSYPAFRSAGTPGRVIGEAGVPQFLDPAVNQTLPWVQRYDLGFYELCFALVLVTILFLTNRKSKRWAGYNVALLALIYAPVRFVFDFLRVIDKTYFGLTPGQYAAFGIFGLGLWILWHRRDQWRGGPSRQGEAGPPADAGSTASAPDTAGAASASDAEAAPASKRGKGHGKGSGKAKGKKKGKGK